MNSVVILAWGLLPVVLVVGWEAARCRRQARTGFIGPVSPEGVRWAQYALAAYQLGYAALALSYIDGRGVPALLLASVVFTCLTTGVLLWDLGERHGSWTPRLTDMRAQCYRSRVAVLRRTQVLGRATRRELADGALLRQDMAAGRELAARADQQLRRLQLALSTAAFLRRISYPDTARAELGILLDEQRRILGEAALFLRGTEPVFAGAHVPLPAYATA
ncbi:MAG: hypothetical protein HYU66_29585 [Armatimonadetes bacterium]|nr:hypothetical protein [Armatimonadota bacterium]